ncbi:MAG: NAD(P)/FAD-dependent oxidoreductase [Fluviibacter sp.]
MPSLNSAQTCDVLVIGGGPAGSTVAPLLAEKGYKVALLEKARHPRFHIGESLLPANLPIFDRLGVTDKVASIGMVKNAAEFNSPWHDHQQRFYFADAWDKSMPSAFQVKRSEFDAILIENAAEKGVEVHQDCRVKSVDLSGSDSVSVIAEHVDGRQERWLARFVVDASGRDTFLANKLQIKHRNPRHNSSSVYAHFDGAIRNDGPDEGNIAIFWFEHGWFWFIPLADGKTSIGMVTWPYFMKTKGDRSLEEFLLDGIKTCPLLEAKLQNARISSPAEATGNFSYVSDRCYGKNYLMLGDAFAFIDPVFSSGVLLAMNSGVVGAETVDTCLRNPAKAKKALTRFDKVMRHGPKEFSWFIYRVTNPTLRDLFMKPRNILRMKEAILSVLAGDIFGKTPIWRSIFVFKCIYYAASIANFKRTFIAWKRRKYNIRSIPESA